mmetsp:Transcript_2136/g.6376  ORF Transcript_2136/g.6376 Transcript_2136/m.6376 type:complete len:313 (-) Transcript_2136:748-1686(-)
MAASFSMFCIEAPENPGVLRAIISISTSEARGFPRMWTFKIAQRPAKSGRSTFTRRSNLPGRSSAWSRISALLVAAITMTPLLASKPSISTRIWFRVCSLSSLPPAMPAPLCRPTASISSMKIIQGAFFLACVKRSRTREAPTPINISTNSEPEMEKNGTPASPATALASSVFPVPGGPSRMTPRGIFAPSSLNTSGSFKKVTTSCSSVLAPSQPATSGNLTPVSGVSWNFAFDRPISSGFMPPGPIPPPPIWFIWLRESRNMPPNRMAGKMSEDINEAAVFSSCCGKTVTSTLCSVKVFSKLGSLGSASRR